MVNSNPMIGLFCLFIGFLSLCTNHSEALFIGELRPGESLNSSSVLVSASREFTLGFNSGYLILRSKDNHTFWVANPHYSWTPNSDPSTALLTLEKNKTVLQITHGGQNHPFVLYSSPENDDDSTDGVVAFLSNTGVLVLQQSTTVFWQSSDHPTVALMPESNLGHDKRTGDYWWLHSWVESQNSPGPGSFSLQWDFVGRELQIARDMDIWWSSGEFGDGRFKFINIPDESKISYSFRVVSTQYEDYFSYNYTAVGDQNIRSVWVLDTDGELYDVYYNVSIVRAVDCDGYNTDGGCRRWSDRVNASRKWTVIASAMAACLLAMVLCSVCYLIHRKKLAVENQKRIQDMLNMMNSSRPTNASGLQSDGKRGQNLNVFKYSSIIAATSNFSDENKLGEGGFGPVYKGQLATGQEIAVKRLSKRSEQGISEFKNELILINELQHTNLVQLFGFCIHGEERMLVYEYMPNQSLDHFLFDSTRCRQLDWNKRFNIIERIAQGLLYLHTYSRVKIIHRDLKASNILLDGNMNPKISDFGMARIFSHDEQEANTRKIVGTRGYMPPEYVMGGNFSTKSDVYSFGVLILEILSGRKNNSFYNDDRAFNLVGHAWALWKESAGLTLADPTLCDSCDKDQMLRCVHVGLLCVEENAASRPTMVDVISMLTNKSMSLPVPTKPAFCMESRNVITIVVGGNGSEMVASVNEMSNSDFEGR